LRNQPTTVLRSLSVLLLASCGPTANDADDTVTAKLPATALVVGRQEREEEAKPLVNEATVENSQASVKAMELRAGMRSQYTSLETRSCKLLEERTVDAGSPRWRCAGAAGYALEKIATEAQHFAIIRPDGGRTELSMAGTAPTGTLGNLAEWRGDATGQPRALIVRVSAEAQPKISSLVVTKLGASPCIVAVIASGPAQNEKARTIADGKQLKCSLR
jgi:hypothetical protein